MINLYFILFMITAFWYIPWVLGTGNLLFITSMDTGADSVMCYIHFIVITFITLAAITEIDT